MKMKEIKLNHNLISNLEYHYLHYLYYISPQKLHEILLIKNNAELISKIRNNEQLNLSFPLLYRKYQEKVLKQNENELTCPADSITLPSTSPANAAWSLDRLAEAWSVILQPLRQDSQLP